VIVHEFLTANMDDKSLKVNADDFRAFVGVLCARSASEVTGGRLYGPAVLAQGAHLQCRVRSVHRQGGVRLVGEERDTGSNGSPWAAVDKGPFLDWTRKAERLFMHREELLNLGERLAQAKPSPVSEGRASARTRQ
jgi:hypothetical protein